MNNLFLYFLREEASLLDDKNLFDLYVHYKNKANRKLINDGDLKSYAKNREYVKILREEIRKRCSREEENK